MLKVEITPIYKVLEGWESSTFGLSLWSKLPKKARNYISLIEELLDTEISVISTGPERSQTIDRKNIL